MKLIFDIKNYGRSKSQIGGRWQFSLEKEKYFKMFWLFKITLYDDKFLVQSICLGLILITSLLFIEIFQAMLLLTLGGFGFLKLLEHLLFFCRWKTRWRLPLRYERKVSNFDRRASEQPGNILFTALTINGRNLTLAARHSYRSRGLAEKQSVN